MTFNSIIFLVTLIPFLIVFYLVPKEHRIKVILAANYVFYAFYNRYLCILLLLYSLYIYLAGRIVENQRKSKNPSRGIAVFIPIIIAAFMPLLVFKYTGPVTELIMENPVNLLLPLGISYFSLKSVGYLIDVFKGHNAELSIVKLMAFVSFFPEMVLGPIDRTDNLLDQFNKEVRFSINNLEKGFWLYIFGCFLKMVVADRLGIIVNAVYNDIYYYEGLPVLIAAMAFSIQLYLEFQGCTLMALGIGKMFGFNLPDNFKRPYMAVSVRDFWRRWHISLTSWLRDYIYIPLGGSRKGTFRKYMNIIIVYSISGIWHGASINFLVWGLLNGFLQIIEDVLEKAGVLPPVSSEKYRLPRVISTFGIMTVTWVFFRANDLKTVGLIFTKMFAVFNPWMVTDKVFEKMGLVPEDIKLLLIVLIVILLIEVFQEKGRDLFTSFMNMGFIEKTIVSYIIIFSIIILGMYGTEFNASDFIYQEF